MPNWTPEQFREYQMNKDNPKVKPQAVIVQPKGDVMNRTERELLEMLQAAGYKNIEFEPMKLRIGLNGKRCFYTPDFLATLDEDEYLYVWEAKGNYVWEDARVKFLSAARIYGGLYGWKFMFAQKKGGLWKVTPA